MAYEPKTGESFISENDLATLCFNERSKSHFAENTVFDFNGCKLVQKISNGNAYLKFADMKKKAPTATEFSDATISASMFLRCPFNKDNRGPLTGISGLQDSILKAVDSPNPGNELWSLIKGRRIKVVKVVKAKDRPFGSDTEAEMSFSVFDYAY